MKYPLRTESQPLSEKEARKVVSAIREGKMLTNPELKATAARIAERRKKMQE